MKKYKKVLNILFLHKSLYVELLIIIVIGIVCSLVQPVLMGYLITDMISLKNRQGVIIIILLFVFYVLSALLTYFQEKKESTIKCITGFDLKEKLYLLLFNVKSSEQKKIQSGEFIAILEHDIDEITEVCATQLINLVVETVKVIIILIVSFMISWNLTITSLLIFPINLLCFYKLGMIINKNEVEMRNNMDIYYNRTQEYTNGLQVIKCLGAKKKIKNTLVETIYKNKKIGVKNGNLTALGTAFVGLMDFVSLIIIYAYGFFLVQHHKLSIELYIAYSSYSATLSSSLMLILQFNPVFQRIKISLERVEAAISDLEKNEEIWGNKKINKINQTLEIRNLLFNYGNRVILNNINVVFPNTGLVVLIGRNGCGKTSFVEMLLRINEPKQGGIYIDGIPNNELCEDSFYNMFSGYLQNNYLFNMTVRENIILGNLNVKDEEIIYWANKIGLYDKFKQLPLGLETIISEQAKNFSGGEIQKICLLRTIIQNSKVMILDEPMSAMDIVSRKKTREALKELSKNRLVILVSHDITDFYMADIKYKLEDGTLELLNQLDSNLG
jgi:ATP-binding cassette subfamily B protein